MDGVVHRHTKPGTAPGSLTGRAPVPDEALDFTLVEYTQEEVEVLHNVEVDECRFHLGTPGRTWIDVAGRPSSEMLRDLGMAFNLHPLALEDVFHGNQRAKLDLYEGQGFIVLNDPSYEEGELSLRQVSIFFGDNYVVSFHDHKQDIFKPVRDRVQTAGSRLRMFGIDYLVYALIDLVVDRKFPLIETLASHLEELEDEALGHPTSETLGHIHQARRTLVTFHRLEWAEREAILLMMRPETPFIMPETRTYLRDCFDLRSELALAKGVPQDALSFAAKAVNAGKSVASTDPVEDKYAVAKSLRLLGDIRRRLGDEGGAKSAWEAGLAMIPANGAEKPNEMAEHAMLLQRLGRLNEANERTNRLASFGYRDVELRRTI